MKNVQKQLTNFVLHCIAWQRHYQFVGKFRLLEKVHVHVKEKMKAEKVKTIWPKTLPKNEDKVKEKLETEDWGNRDRLTEKFTKNEEWEKEKEEQWTETYWTNENWQFSSSINRENDYWKPSSMQYNE